MNRQKKKKTGGKLWGQFPLERGGGGAAVAKKNWEERKMHTRQWMERDKWVAEVSGAGIK